MARDNFNNDELTNYYSKVYASLDNETTADPFGNYILGRVKGGQKTVTNKSQSEIRNFDMSFLDTIESCYPALTKIMRDPKRTLRYETDVVPVEKVKKVNSDTVRHLASHTQLIKEVKKNGDVIPLKVQTTFAEDELATYENRFIKTLVIRIEKFLERRYDVMKVSLESFETEMLNVKNEFKMSGQNVTVEINVGIKNDLTTDADTTKEQFDRLLSIREQVHGLRGTEFMKALAKAKDVLPPIMKTNIILHNPDFKLCYGLWLYLDRVDAFATNVDVKERSYRYTQVFDKDINECMALALTSFIKNRNIEDVYASKKLPQQKAPKPIVDNTPELELNLEPDNNKMEDYTMNELLLSQTAKFFESSMEGMDKSGVTFNESVRVVYRQMLDMLDQIYPLAFGVSDDELDSADLYEQLEYARRQMMILKIVRQQKQMNLARMGKEEKRVEKLMDKLEDKIKKQEARERERLEREAAKIEAERQAQIERQKAIEARKRKFENEAIEKAKLVELRRQDMLESDKEKREKERESLSRIYEAHQSKRNHLKEVQEAENKDFKPMTPTEIAESAPAELPHRRRDEYDDLSDEELEALMKENELLLEQIPEKDPDLIYKDEDTSKPTKKAKESSKPTSKKKSIEDISDDLNDLSDADLDALLAENGLLDDSGADFNFSDVSDDKPEEKKEKPVIGKKKSKKKEEPKEETPVEEPKVEEPVQEETPQDEVETLEPKVEGTPEVEETPTEEVPTEETTVEEEPTEEVASEEPEAEPEVEEPQEEEPKIEAPSDDIEDITDDDLDALLADIPDKIEEEAPAEETPTEETPEPQAEPEEPKKKNKKKASDDDTDDDLEDLSDEDLEALLKENGMI